MRLNDDDIKKIEALFRQILIIGIDSSQFYNPEEEYRTRYLIKKANSLYVNVPAGKMNKWHMTIFDKKKKHISLTPFIEEFPEQGITRIGFKK